MDWVTYLPEVECIVTDNGIPAGTTVVSVPDEDGRKHSLLVAKGDVLPADGKTYLEIGVVYLDYPKKRALIELPTEAGSGTRRLWVPFTRFRRQGESKQ